MANITYLRPALLRDVPTDRLIVRSNEKDDGRPSQIETNHDVLKD